MEVSTLQAFQYIDTASAEGRLYHYNGGQAYIKLHKDSNLLLVIDHTTSDSVAVYLHDGKDYFSGRSPVPATELAKWYSDHYIRIPLDVVS